MERREGPENTHVTVGGPAAGPASDPLSRGKGKRVLRGRESWSRGHAHRRVLRVVLVPLASGCRARPCCLVSREVSGTAVSCCCNRGSTS